MRMNANRRLSDIDPEHWLGMLRGIVERLAKDRRKMNLDTAKVHVLCCNLSKSELKDLNL